MRCRRIRIALAAILVAVPIGTGAAGAEDSPCGDWGPYPPAVDQRASHNQDGGRKAEVILEDGGLVVELWCTHETWFDGDNGGRGHFELHMWGPYACDVDLDTGRDTFVVDPQLETASLRSFAPGCEASIDWEGTGIRAASVYAGAADGSGPGAGVGPDLDSVGAGAGITQSRNAIPTGTILGQAMPSGAGGLITHWEGRGLFVGR